MFGQRTKFVGEVPEPNTQRPPFEIEIPREVNDNTYEVIGVECKINGYLKPEEKEKCKWLIDNNKFSKILIAKKGTKRGEIIYDEFENK